MYKLVVEPFSKQSFVFKISFNEQEVSRGYRSSESSAHRDGAEELKFCRLFNVGRQPDVT